MPCQLRAFSVASVGIALSTLAASAVSGLSTEEDGFRWRVHDDSRPKPPVVAIENGVPADAMVLVGIESGTDALRSGDGPCQWSFADGVLTIAPGAGDIHTKDVFGDCQLHLEWQFPEGRSIKGQMGGNSGVFFLDRYEFQILHTFENESYADGMAGSIYGQFPPLVNPIKAAGLWNSYDIVFRGPRFDDGGGLIRPATITALINGVLAQDHVSLLGPTRHKARTSYEAHESTGPLRFQDHGDPISFRNVWVRPIPEPQLPE